MKKVLPFLSLLLLLTACDSKKNKLILKSSTGRINAALVVIEDKNWNSVVGETLKTIFTNPIEGLPQPEAQLSLTHISPDKFNSLFENNRNILVVGIKSQSQFEIVNDKYALPQIVISIFGSNQSDLINQIKTHQQEIIEVFKKGDLALYQKKLSHKIWNSNEFEVFKNTKIILPKDYVKVKDSTNFLWLRKYLKQDGTLNILAYKISLQANDSLNLLYLINQRNKIGAKHIPGQFFNTYMQTAPDTEPTLEALTINGLSAYEMRGLWEVKNDFMGGAFINETFKDSVHNQLICLDGFVYAPNQDKRDYIFELEAIFKTFKPK